MSGQLVNKLKRTIPSQRFRLPSKGYFYIDGELDENVHEGEIDIYPMNSRHELLLLNADHLLNGTAITTIISDCVPAVNKPEKLLTADIDFLFVAIRLVTFGPNLDVTWEHHCEKAKKHKYELDVNHVLKGTRYLETEGLEQSCRFKVLDFDVEIEPITHEMNLARQQDRDEAINSKTRRLQEIQATIVAIRPEKRKEEETETAEEKQAISNFITTAQELITESRSLSKQLNSELEMNRLLWHIKRVDNITDKNEIKEWLYALDRKSVAEIKQHVNVLYNFGVTFDFPVACKDCGEEMSLNIDLNPETFFSEP